VVPSSVGSMTATADTSMECFRTPVPLRRNRLHWFTGRTHEVLDEPGQPASWATTTPERGETVAELVALQARVQAQPAPHGWWRSRKQARGSSPSRITSADCAAAKPVKHVAEPEAAPRRRRGRGHRDALPQPSAVQESMRHCRRTPPPSPRPMPEGRARRQLPGCLSPLRLPAIAASVGGVRDAGRVTKIQLKVTVPRTAAPIIDRVQELPSPLAARRSMGCRRSPRSPLTTWSSPRPTAASYPRLTRTARGVDEAGACLSERPVYAASRALAVWPLVPSSASCPVSVAARPSHHDLGHCGASREA